MNKEEYHRLLNLRKIQEEMLYMLIKETGKTPREIINLLSMNHKRAWYILEKWSIEGKYEYGVSLDLGWLVDKAN